jgi:hypothetical protein
MAQGIDEKIKRRFDENKLNSQAPTPMAPVGQSQAGNVGVQQPAGAPAKSGAFTNVQSFLKANQGAGSRLADKTTEGVERGVQQATGQVGQFEKQVGGAVDKEKARVEKADTIAEQVKKNLGATPLPVDPQITAPTSGRPEGGITIRPPNRDAGGRIRTPTDAEINKPVSNDQPPSPEQIAAMQNHLQNISGSSVIPATPTTPNILNDEDLFNQARQLITGETAVADITQQKQQLGSQAGAALTQAGQQTGQLGTQSGRFNLLRKAVGGPMYTQGMSGLDNLLLSTEGGQKLGQAQRDLSGALRQSEQTLGTKVDEFGNALTDIGTLANKAKETVSTAVTDTQSELSKQLEAQRKAAEDEVIAREKNIEAIRSGQGLTPTTTSGEMNIGNTALSPEQEAYYNLIDQLGGSDAPTYNTSLDNFIRDAGRIENQWDVANQDQALRFNRLNELLGTTSTQAAGGKTAADFGKQVNADAFKAERAAREKSILEELSKYTGDGFVDGKLNDSIVASGGAFVSENTTAAGQQQNNQVSANINASLVDMIQNPDKYQPLDWKQLMNQSENVSALDAQTVAANYNKKIQQAKQVAERIRQEKGFNTRLIRK